MRLLLVRHATHDLAGRALAGRLPGLGLNAKGQAQAARLPQALGDWPIRAIHCSPQQRTRETAAPVAAARRLPVVEAPEFDEVDFGDWTGRAFEDIAAAQPALWRQWCDRRGEATPPGGEAFAAVAARVADGLGRLLRAHAQDVVLLVSHADVIKATVAGVLGLSLDGLERFAIDCCTLTVLDMEAGWVRLERLNAPLAVD